MQSIKRASDMSEFPVCAPWPLGAAYIPILLSEVEQEQIHSGNGDREAIVVGAGLRDGEGERANNGYAPHYNVFASRTNVFSFLEDVLFINLIPLDLRRWSSQDLV